MDWITYSEALLCDRSVSEEVCDGSCRSCRRRARPGVKVESESARLIEHRDGTAGISRV
jgi:hypothetical protein